MLLSSGELFLVMSYFHRIKSEEKKNKNSGKVRKESKHLKAYYVQQRRNGGKHFVGFVYAFTKSEASLIAKGFDKGYCVVGYGCHLSKDIIRKYLKIKKV